MAKLKIVLISTVIFLGVFVTSVSAENSSTDSASAATNNTAPTTKPIKEIRRETMDLKKESIRDTKLENKEAMKNKRLEFKEKLMEIRDTKKQGIVDKVDVRILEMNKDKTGHFNEVLTKLETLLTRIGSESAMLKSEGKSTIALDAAISSAQTALVTSKTAVANQSQKEYVIAITNETALRSNVNTTFSQFKADIKTTRQTVNAARLAVMKASMELKKLKGDTMRKNATNSALMEQ